MEQRVSFLTPPHDKLIMYHLDGTGLANEPAETERVCSHILCDFNHGE